MDRSLKYNAVSVPVGTQRSVYVQQWMVDFCKHHGVSMVAGPELINYFIWYVSTHYDELQEAGNAPTPDDNTFIFRTTDDELLKIVLGRCSKKTMQSTIRPKLCESGYLKMIDDGGKGLTIEVNFDVLNAYLISTSSYVDNDVKLRRNQRKVTSNTLYIEESKGEEETPSPEETVTVKENTGWDPIELAMEIESVISRNRKLDKARRKLMLDNPTLDIDSFKKSFNHWLCREYTDFQLFDDGRGLLQLMELHVAFLLEGGPSSNFKSSSGHFWSRAEQVVEWMMENQSDRKQDVHGARYTFFPDGQPRPMDEYLKEKETISLGLSKNIIKESHLRLYMGYAHTFEFWPGYEHVWFFRAYDLDNPAGIFKYREMMRYLAGYVLKNPKAGPGIKDLAQKCLNDG